mmetsp:Transcript_30877/g.69365  ORF Transcript_30877/g.69365 Transcript_30877/m.69365 type:complete len:470 (-) Transcript_30877:303-1712(-)
MRILGIVLLVSHAASFTHFSRPSLVSPQTRDAGRTLSIASVSRTADLAETEEEEDGRRPRGRLHTEASKLKISAANKGNVPWNKGGSHREETRLKIAATVRRNQMLKRQAHAAEMGLTLEELEEQERQQKEEKKVKAKEKKSRGLSPETRAKISAKLKARWANETYKAQMLAVLKNTPRNAHTEATKQKISETLKKRYAEDPEYKAKLRAAAASVSPEVRARISATLKAKWKDPEYRASKLANRGAKLSPEHKKAISEAIKKKWREDEEYRSSAVQSMRSANRARRDLNPHTEPKPRPPRKKAPPKPRAEKPKVRKEPASKSSRAPAVANGSLDSPRLTSSKGRNGATARGPVSNGVNGAEKSSHAALNGDLKGDLKSASSEEGEEGESNGEVAIGSARESVVDEEKERIERLRVSNPDLWQALYADDDDLVLPAAPPPKPTRRGGYSAVGVHSLAVNGNMAPEAGRRR